MIQGTHQYVSDAEHLIPLYVSLIYIASLNLPCSSSLTYPNHLRKAAFPNCKSGCSSLANLWNHAVRLATLCSPQKAICCFSQSTIHRYPLVFNSTFFSPSLSHSLQHVFLAFLFHGPHIAMYSLLPPPPSCTPSTTCSSYSSFTFTEFTFSVSFSPLTPQVWTHQITFLCLLERLFHI